MKIFGKQITFPKFELIDDIEKAWKLYSVWFFVILGFLPQMWDQAVASGLLDSPLIPGQFKALVGTISSIALIARLIKQSKGTIEAEVKAKIAEDAAEEAAKK